MNDRFEDEVERTLAHLAKSTDRRPRGSAPPSRFFRIAGRTDFLGSVDRSRFGPTEDVSSLRLEPWRSSWRWRVSPCWAVSRHSPWAGLAGAVDCERVARRRPDVHDRRESTGPPGGSGRLHGRQSHGAGLVARRLEVRRPRPNPRVGGRPVAADRPHVRPVRHGDRVGAGFGLRLARLEQLRDPAARSPGRPKPDRRRTARLPGAIGSTELTPLGTYDWIVAGPSGAVALIRPWNWTVNPPPTYVVVSAGGAVSAPRQGYAMAWSRDGSMLAVLHVTGPTGAHGTGSRPYGWPEVVRSTGESVASARQVASLRTGRPVFSPDGARVAFLGDSPAPPRTRGRRRPAQEATHSSACFTWRQLQLLIADIVGAQGARATESWPGRALTGAELSLTTVRDSGVGEGTLATLLRRHWPYADRRDRSPFGIIAPRGT